MFMTRRLRQPLQPFFQCRSFAVDDYLDTPDVDSDAEDDGAATAKKAKVMSKKKNKNSTTVNPKQRVENLQTFYDAAEAALKFKPAFTDEEKADHFRIGLTFNKEAFKRHNREGKDFATKIWLSSDALETLNSLRPDLKEQACIVDMTPPPPDRPWPMFITPPIKGFRLKDYVKKEKDTNSDFQI